MPWPRQRRPPEHPRSDEGDHRRSARELSQHAPRIVSLKIDPDKIGLLIGKGGETIRGLQDEFEAQIDVNDEGQVNIYATRGELAEALKDRIAGMTKEVELATSSPARSSRPRPSVRSSSSRRAPTA